MNVTIPTAASVCEALVAALADFGVRHAFGVSGGGIAALWAALSKSGIAVAHFRHESGAAFAAIEAYFATDEPVVVFTTTGPGLTNALTGLLAARDEGAKIILLSGCTPAAQRMRWAIQETGAGAVPAGLFHMAATLDAVSALPQIMRRIANGLAGPSGFVCHLALPADVQSAVAPTLPRGMAYCVTPQAPVDRVADLLDEGGVAIWLGFGARGAAGPVRALAERLGAPVMCSPRAKGIFPEDHALFVGVTGMGGHDSVLAYMDRHAPRRILVLGTRLGEPTSFWDPALIPADGFIHVDVDPNIPGTAYPSATTLAIRAEIGAFVTALLERLPVRPAPAPQNLPHPVIPPRSTTDGLVRPAALMASIQRVVIDAHDALVLAECGNAFAWATHLLRFRRPGRYRVSTGVGAMGHCAAGVVGAAHASGRRAVAIVGDGAMLMNNEINTAVALGAPATWIVLNDGRYNMCAQGMASLGLWADASIPQVDFAMLARSMGAQGRVVADEVGLDAALQAALTATGPSLLDVHIDPASRAPAAGRNRGLGAPIAARAAAFPHSHAMLTSADTNDGI